MSFQKRCISILTTAALVFTTISSPSVSVNAARINELVEGNYGDNVTYTYFRDNFSGSNSLSCVILEGTGKTMDIDESALDEVDAQYDNQPWLQEAFDEKPNDLGLMTSAKIDEILVGGDITELGAYTFCNYGTTIRLNKNITNLPDSCFAWTSGCKLYFYGELEDIDEYAFDTILNNITTDIYVVSEQSQQKVIKAINNSMFNNKVMIMENPTDIVPLRIAVKKGLIEERLNDVNEYKRYTVSTLATYLKAVKEGQEKLNDKNISEKDVTTYTLSINDAAKDLVSLEERNEALYKAEALPTWHYTEESVKALQAAMETAKKVADNATKEDVAKLTKGVNDAIDNLQPISLEDAKKMFTATLDNAKKLIESDYEEEGWTTLQDVITAEGTIAGNATAGAILDSRQNIINAISLLVPVYSDPSPLAEFFSGDTNTLIIEGIADSTLAGSKRAVIEFDCASDVSYNEYTSIDLAYQIGEQSKQSKRFPGRGDYTNGTKGWKETLEFSSILKEGDSYSLSGGTLSWTNAKGVVFLIQAVSFFSEDGALLKRVVAPPTAGLNKVLTNAEEKLKNLKTVDYTEESVKKLTDAIAEAKDVMAQEDTIVQSTLTRLMERLEAAIDGLTLADATPTQQKLATTLSSAKALNAADYTPESWAVLQQAIQKAEALPANSLNSAILPVLEELEQAIKALVPVVKTVEPAPIATEGVITTPESITTPPAVKIKKVQVEKKKAKLSIQLKKKIKKKKADSYQITIAKTKNFKKSTSAVVKNTGKAKISISYKKLKIKKKNTYYLKVRTVKATDNGKKAKGKYSNIVKFKAR